MFVAQAVGSKLPNTQHPGMSELGDCTKLYATPTKRTADEMEVGSTEEVAQGILVLAKSNGGQGGVRL